MSDPAAPVEQGRWRRLAPREREHRGSGSLRLVETTLLVLLGVLLAVATVNDVARQAKINHRLIADIATWRHYTGHAYHNLGVDQEVLGITTHRDVVCGNTVPGPPKARVQICLVVEGATRGGRRQVTGGWYLPVNTEDDVRDHRYGCFGRGAAGLCP
jgi:hypothetical protein